ncbi:hypothetical protein L0F63_005938, partial [Massospora cicadina]
TCQPLSDIDSASEGSPVPQPTHGFIGREKCRFDNPNKVVFKEHEAIKSGYVRKRYRTRK